MKIGITSFVFRYSFMDSANSARLREIICRARQAGVERLQVCENAQPLEMSKAEWQETIRCAADLGVELQLGCKTLTPAVVAQYVELAQTLSCNQLRIVMEEPPQRASRDTVTRLLEAVVPQMQAAGMRLAIENHFDISSALLFELVSSYPSDVVGFCIDTANSLRSIESPREVVRRLRERAYCYHLKDYRVVGSLISFSVVGAPLGEGDLDLDGCLRLLMADKPVRPLFVENWTPTSNDLQRDLATEADWLNRSIKNLRSHLQKYV
jgi:3-oxoisoapionate decarboxylase